MHVVLVDHLQKNKERIQKFQQTGQSWYIHHNKLDKACLQHGMAYWDFKYLTRRTTSGKILPDKAFNIVKNPRYDGCQRDFLQWSIIFLGKKTSERTVKNENMSIIWRIWQLCEELLKPIIRNFMKRTRLLMEGTDLFINNIFGADLADMQMISKFDKEICFLICIIHMGYSFER